MFELIAKKQIKEMDDRRKCIKDNPFKASPIFPKKLIFITRTRSPLERRNSKNKK